MQVGGLPPEHQHPRIVAAVNLHQRLYLYVVSCSQSTKYGCTACGTLSNLSNVGVQGAECLAGVLEPQVCTNTMNASN